MSDTRTTEAAWLARVQEVYTDAKPEDFTRRADGAIFFRLPPPDSKAECRAAWFPQHAFGYIDVRRT